jgi:hypothetical protein
VERRVCVSFDGFHSDCGLRLLCLVMGGMQISFALSESGMMIVSFMPNSFGNSQIWAFKKVADYKSLFEPMKFLETLFACAQRLFAKDTKWILQKYKIQVSTLSS